MALQFAILGLLTYAPMNGYYLKKIFDTSINHFWSANLSQIYRELGVLEMNNNVTSSILPQDEKPDKKVYSITDKGRKTFLEWLETFPDRNMPPKRDEFMVRIFFGSKLDKQHLISEFENFIRQREEDKRAISVLKHQSQFIIDNNEAEKQFFLGKALKDRYDDFSYKKEALFWSFTLNRAEISLDGLIKWAQECVSKLETV